MGYGCFISVIGQDVFLLAQKPSRPPSRWSVGGCPHGHGGRPPKQVKAEERITIRVTSFEKLAIAKKAEAVGLSSSEYCRRAALERHITPALTAEETEAYLTLKKFATDFARLRNAFKVGAPTLVEEIRQVIYKLNAELDYIRNGKQSKGS